jgi:hypothetical protein
VSADVSRVRAVFDAAAAAVEAGELRRAAEILDSQLAPGAAGGNSYARAAVQDWLADVQLRLAVDAAASIARSRAIVLAAARA